MRLYGLPGDNSAAPSLGASLLAAAASIALVAYAPTLYQGMVLQAPAASITTNAPAPTLSASISAPSASMALSGTAPALGTATALSCPSPVSATLTGTSPSISAATALQPPCATLALTGRSATLAASLAATPNSLIFGSTAPALAFALPASAQNPIAHGHRSGTSLVHGAPGPGLRAHGGNSISGARHHARRSCGFDHTRRVLREHRPARARVGAVARNFAPDRIVSLNAPCKVASLLGFSPSLLHVGSDDLLTHIAQAAPRRYDSSGSARNYVTESYTQGRELIATARTRTYVSTGAPRRYTA